MQRANSSLRLMMMTRFCSDSASAFSMRGVARADDQDRLVLVFLGIVQLILDDAQVLAGHAQLAQVALQADGEHDVLRRRPCSPFASFSVNAPFCPVMAVTPAP